MHVHSLVTLLLTYGLYVSAVPLSSLSALMNPVQSHPASKLPAFADTHSPTLSLARRFNSTGSANVLKFDQARARTLQQRTQTNADSDDGTSLGGDALFDESVTSQVVTYVATVEIGEPPQSYHLLVDTGSSNTWVGAGKEYMPTFSTRPTGEAFSITYGSGKAKGFEVKDSITLDGGLTIKHQSIGVAITSSGFNGLDGILGIGPSGLTCGSYFPDTHKCVPTVTDNAWNAGLLDSYQIGISFRPSTTINNKNGELTFGGVDHSKYDGELNWTPLTDQEPAREYVGIDQSVTYGDSPVLPVSAGILDTGTTLILLASDAFQRYQSYTGGVLDDQIGLLRITPEQYKNLQSLYFQIGGIRYELTPNAQIWPRALNRAIGGSPHHLYLVVNDLGTTQGIGLDFINGMAFLERFYMVYDIGNNRVGLATTEYTSKEIN